MITVWASSSLNKHKWELSKGNRHDTAPNYFIFKKEKHTYWQEQFCCLCRCSWKANFVVSAAVRGRRSVLVVLNYYYYFLSNTCSGWNLQALAFQMILDPSITRWNVTQLISGLRRSVRSSLNCSWYDYSRIKWLNPCIPRDPRFQYRSRVKKFAFMAVINFF